jgi:hypothetical protein
MTEKLKDFIGTTIFLVAVNYFVIHPNDPDHVKRFFISLLTASISALILVFYRQKIKDWIKGMLGKRS